MIPRDRRVFVCTEPVDMRRSIDGLRKTVVDRFGEDASTSLYVFTNKKRDRAKLLWRISVGWCVLYEKLDQHRFQLPSSSTASKRVSLDRQSLARLLRGVPTRRHQTERDIAREARRKVQVSTRKPCSSTTKSPGGAYTEA